MDKTRLTAQIRRALQTRHQISLADLVKSFPLEQGLAELVAYLSLATEDDAAVIDDTHKQELSWVDSEGTRRRATLPLVIFSGHAGGAHDAAATTANLSPVLIALMKGITSRDDDPAIWQALLELQARVREYVAVLGLELILDEAEGYAYLRQRAAAEGEPELARLVARRQLGYR